MRKRILSITLCIAMVFGLSVNAFASDVFGYAHIERSEPIGEGTTLVQNQFYNGSSKQSEKYINYTPNETVKPMVYYGSKLYGRSTINTVTSKLEAEGLRVHAAVNADFFSYTTGLPLGMLVNNGVVNSSCTTENAIAFYEDGRAYIGTPGFSTTMTVGETSYTVNHVNKLRQPYGIYLLTDCFSSSTRTTTEGYDVIIRPDEGSEYRLGQDVNVTVVDAFPSSEAILIPEGCWVLTVDMTAGLQYTSVLSSLKVGDTITINSDVTDPYFARAAYIVGGGSIILQNGAVIDNSDTASAPRTALGIKADGTVVLYTIDGRQSSISVGASVNRVAERLKELGCVVAINLDGGGSTAISAAEGGEDKASVLNSPSDGTPRSCANYIVLVSSAAGSGVASGINIGVSHGIVLKGSTIDLSATGYDESYKKAALGEVTYASDGGVISGNKFTPTQSGTVVINAESGSASGTRQITVISTPYSISMQANGTACSQLTVEAGSSTAVTGVATGGLYSYYYDQGSFTFSSNVVNGVYTAPEKSGTDTITVSCGTLSVSVPVTVTTLKDPTVEFSATEETALLKVGGAYESAEILIDGKTAETLKTEGVFTASYELTDGMHRISAVVLGSNGSRIRNSVTVSVGEGISPFDDTAEHWAKDYASYLYSTGVTGGELLSDGKRMFYPDNKITRQEFVKMMVSYLGTDVSLYADTELPYADLQLIADWALPYVRAAYALGIMTGSEQDGKTVFLPSDSVTRAQVIATTGRSLESGYSPAEIAFSDKADIPSWTGSYTGILVGLGIISGYDDNTLRPNNPITRGEAAKMLTSMY